MTSQAMPKPAETGDPTEPRGPGSPNPVWIAYGMIGRAMGHADMRLLRTLNTVSRFYMAEPDRCTLSLRVYLIAQLERELWAYTLAQVAIIAALTEESP